MIHTRQQAVDQMQRTIFITNLDTESFLLTSSYTKNRRISQNYLNKVVADCNRQNDHCEERRGEADDEQRAEDPQQTEDPRAERHGDHLIHSKYVLMKKRAC